jgi:hypothetical protein
MYKDGTLRKMRVEMMGEDTAEDVENLEDYQHLDERVN